MPEIDFNRVFSRNTFLGLSNTIKAFLEMQGAQNATLDFEDMKVAFHTHKGEVELHILTGDNPEPLNKTPEDKEFEEDGEE